MPTLSGTVSFKRGDWMPPAHGKVETCHLPVYVFKGTVEFHRDSMPALSDERIVAILNDYNPINGFSTDLPIGVYTLFILGDDGELWADSVLGNVWHFESLTEQGLVLDLCYAKNSYC
jgi:hypothetical protein